MNKIYLQNEIIKHVSAAKSSRHLRAYYFIRSKRFLMHTFAIFFFQYLTISSLPVSFPALPMYAPIGIAFAMFYLLGNNSLVGLLLGGFCAYLSQGLSAFATTCYLLADIGCGYLGASICQNIFASDITTSIKFSHWLKFIATNAFTTCLLSSLFRILAIHNFHLPVATWLYTLADFWLADLNAILAFSAFLFSWISIYLSREKISSKRIKKIFVIGSLIATVFAVFFIKKIILFYFLILAGAGILYLASIYGYLIATLLLYVFSLIYTAYFMAHETQYLHAFGIQYYTLAPLFLLIFIISTLFAGIRLFRD